MSLPPIRTRPLLRRLSLFARRRYGLVFAAAWMGRTRLIDNMPINGTPKITAG